MGNNVIENIDTEKVSVIVHNIKANVHQYEDVCTELVNQCSSGLNNIMEDLYTECIKDPNPSIDTLERYYLELSNYIYFMIEKVEMLGIHADVSGETYKEAYSKSYINLSSEKDAKKTTVAEIQAIANVESQYESVVKSVYERAYKIVKGKLTAAQDMMNCIRKILSTRSTEMQLSMYSDSKFRPKEVED